MAPKPSLPQHPGSCLFMLSVCPSSSYSCSCSPAVKVSFFYPHTSHPRVISCKVFGEKPGVAVQLHSMLSVTLWFALTPLLSFFHCLLTPFPASFVWSQQEQMEMKRFSVFPKWCLLCMSWTSHHVWWGVNFSCTHFYQVDGMGVSSFSCFQNGLGLWNMTGKSSSLQGWCFLVSME